MSDTTITTQLDKILSQANNLNQMVRQITGKGVADAVYFESTGDGPIAKIESTLQELYLVQEQTGTMIESIANSLG